MTNKYFCLKVYQRESWHRVSVEEINFNLTSIDDSGTKSRFCQENCIENSRMMQDKDLRVDYYEFIKDEKFFKTTAP